jgi:hypothetical protein
LTGGNVETATITLVRAAAKTFRKRTRTIIRQAEADKKDWPELIEPSMDRRGERRIGRWNRIDADQIFLHK